MGEIEIEIEIEIESEDEIEIESEDGGNRALISESHDEKRRV